MVENDGGRQQKCNIKKLWPRSFHNVQLQVTDGLDWHNPEVTFEEVSAQGVEYSSQIHIDINRLLVSSLTD